MIFELFGFDIDETGWGFWFLNIIFGDDEITNESQRSAFMIYNLEGKWLLDILWFRVIDKIFTEEE